MIVVEDALLPWRKKALNRFLELGSKLSFPDAATPASLAIDPVPSTIVFVDGFLHSAPANLICLPLQDALKTYGLFLQNRWAKQTDNPLVAMNTALSQGVFLYIPNSAHKLHIQHIITTEKLVSPRMHIVLGKSANLTLTQSYEYRVENPFCNQVIEVALEPNANFKLYDVQIAPKTAEVYTTVNTSIKKDASFSLFHGTDGAKTEELSCTAELIEPNGNFELKSLCMLNEERKASVKILVDHAAPHCTSRQHAKMVLNGNSRSHFEGKIYVRSPAQKTEAYQLNNNLLLSKSAIATTEPNLEIFADDVKASHGATLAKLSEEELFYLRARGIGKEDAKSLLTHAFCRELIDAVPFNQPLLDAMERAIHA